MDTTVKLDETHFKRLRDKACELGLTPEEYLNALIDADSQGFDETLRLIRQGFDTLSDDELNDLLDRAQKHARQ